MTCRVRHRADVRVCEKMRYTSLSGLHSRKYVLFVDALESMLTTRDEIVRFYERTRFVLFPDSRFRQFSFRFSPTNVAPVRKTIRTESDLRKLAIKNAPISIYCTKGKFLQAKNIGKRRKAERPGLNNLSDNILLSGDFVLDFDKLSFGGDFGTCYRMMRKTRDYLMARANTDKKPLFDYSWTRAVFSGRGYHLWFFDFYVPETCDANPKNRENEYKVRTRKIVAELWSEGFRFDKKVALNTRNVFRVPGSFNQKNGETVVVYPSFDHHRQKAESRVTAANLSPSYPGGMIYASHVPENPGEALVNGGNRGTDPCARSKGAILGTSCPRNCPCRTGISII